VARSGALARADLGVTRGPAFLGWRLGARIGEGRSAPWKAAGWCAAWCVAALLFSLSRERYQDEWYSVELALATDWARFVDVLRQDLHLPWTALVDRGAGAVGGIAGLALVHVGVSAGALWFAARAFERQVAVPTRWVVLAALGPQFFYFAGSLRWFTFLFLGQALRCYALWGARADGAPSRGAFAAGCLIGTGAGVIDVPFVAHDLGWLVWLARKRNLAPGNGVRNVLPDAIVAALSAALALWITPRLWEMPAAGLAAHRLELRLEFLARFVLTGVAGEGHPPWPYCLLAVVVPLAVAAGVMRMVAAPTTRPFGVWLAAIALLWLGATLRGIWNPRYALLATLLMTASLSVLWRGAARPGRALVAATAGYLSIGLVLVLSGRGMLTMERNRTPRDACPEVVPPAGTDLVILAAPGVEESVSHCQLGAPTMVIPELTAYELGAGRAPAWLPDLGGRRAISLLAEQRRSVGPARVDRTFDELRAHLTASGCTRERVTEAVDICHADLRRKMRAPTKRFFREDWRCATRGPDPIGRHDSGHPVFLDSGALGAGIDPEHRARLAAELLFGAGDLAQLLEHQAPELAAREGEVVRDVGDLQAELGGEIRIGRPRLVVVGEVVALEEQEVLVLALRRELASKGSDGEPRERARELLVEERLDGGGLGRSRPAELAVRLLEVEHREDGAAAALEPPLRDDVVDDEALEAQA
jgi:hypothetical protein